MAAVDTTPAFETWTYVDGEWLPGNPPLIGPTSHAMWLGSTVFDGARYFEGMAPDLDEHCKRINRSARALGLRPTKTSEEIEALVWEGLKNFKGAEAVYIKPMYWAEHGLDGLVPADPASTRFALCLFETPMRSTEPVRLTVSPYRRPSPEVAMTHAKTGSLYPNSGRMMLEARARGFDNALALDMLGNVAETASANIFLVKDGIPMTPADNGCFLAGITRKRILKLFRDNGIAAKEKTLTVKNFLEADELFLTGNYNKVVPVIKLDDRDFEPGPMAKQAMSLYMDWARSTCK